MEKHDTVDSLGLAEAFPPPREDQWRGEAEALLKGAPFEKVLMTPTHEGFAVKPLYTRADLEAVPHATEWPGAGLRTRGESAAGYHGRTWRISQELFEPTPSALNKVLLHQLERGQDELNIWFDALTREGRGPAAGDRSSTGRCGVSAATAEDFEALFKNVRLDAVSVFLRVGAAPAALGALFFRQARAAGYDPAVLEGCLDLDPLGVLVERGQVAGGLPGLYDQMESLMRFGLKHAPRMQMANASGNAYHDGGASSAQELGCVLATALAYLREMESRGLDPAAVAPRIRLSLSVGSPFFIEIAKLRAGRMLWNRIQEVAGIPEDERSCHLHARTGLWNKTRFDAHTSMLRVTSEAFSAVLGGCDSLHVGAFDEVVREPDAFSRRIARNIHPILSDECELTKVIDPVGGSWAVESLTDEMARKAWAHLQEIEAAGGMADAFEKGLPQGWVKATRAARLRDFHRRKDVLIGINQYPEAAAKLPPPRAIDYAACAKERAREFGADTARAKVASKAGALDALAKAANSAERIELAVSAADAGAALPDLHAALRGSRDDGAAVETIPFRRLAEDYENLRLASLAAAESEAGSPRILQLNIGPSRRYRMRADWTSSFFVVGGFEVLAADDFEDTGAAVAAVREAAPPVAVITSDDETYASVLPDLAKAVKEAAPDIILLLAGNPGDQEAAWRAAGIDDFVHVRVNNYEVNHGLLARLGVVDGASEA
ncbi:MAG: acyl-CoA mutase large subunit family protein [Opitutales bacterium]|nr:acyl-CoA mutase large subunit family protein [Opitutales bacterium]